MDIESSSGSVDQDLQPFDIVSVDEVADRHARSGENMAQESRRILDEKVAELETCIRQLKSQRNELAPISRLPPEVLGTIFAFAIVGRYSSSPPLSWYYFTHVCRSWRSVALSTPRLWCAIPSHRKWATAMLERSRNADLIVKSSLSYATSTSSRVLFLKQVFNDHTHRIREIDLGGLVRSTLLTLFGNLPQSSLQLHYLRLQSDTIGDSAFPTNALDTSRLRHLEADHCEVAWFSLPFPALTRLKISNIVPRPPFADFVAALQGMPFLEHLEMQDSLPVATESLTLTTRRVNLAQLKTLCLYSSRNYNEVLNPLSILVVPPAANVKLVCKSGDTTRVNLSRVNDIAASFSAFFSALCSGNNEELSYRNCQVRSEYFDHLNLKAWKNDDEGVSMPSLDLTVTQYILTSFEPSLQQIFRSLPILDLTTLTLDVDLPKKILVETFGSLSCLRNVNLIGRESTSLFITALMHKPEDYNTTQSAFFSVSFPALQCLRIQDTSFSPETALLSVEDLLDCLMERCERGAELTKLIITSCFNIYADDVDLLEEIVVDVEWDGEEMEDWSEEEEFDPEYDEPEYYDDDYYDDAELDMHPVYFPF